jgi:hypothetical protein
MPSDLGSANPDFQALRFAAMLKAARDFGLDQEVVNAISLIFDPRRPDLAQVSEALAEALLARSPLEVPDAA